MTDPISYAFNALTSKKRSAWNCNCSRIILLFTEQQNWQNLPWGFVNIFSYLLGPNSSSSKKKNFDVLKENDEESFVHVFLSSSR